MTIRRRIAPLTRILLATGLTALTLTALPGPADAQEIAAPEAGGSAWMLAATALVLLLAIPGLALFYGGAARGRTGPAALTQAIAVAGVVTVVWIVIGYSLAFSNGGPVDLWLGGSQRLMLSGATVDPLGGTVPETVFAIFQLAMAIVAATLICGAVAGRMTTSALLWFAGAWILIVYCPVAHWVWGGGFLGAPDPAGDGVLDFAGGTVVHITAGIAGLVAALVLGGRIGVDAGTLAPRAPVRPVVGAVLVWVGWVGIIAGSALATGGHAGMAIAITQIAAAAAGLTWTLAEWGWRGRPSGSGILSGAVAGLVAITSAAGYVSPAGALWIGGIAGIVCFVAVTGIATALKQGGALDVFGLHGVGGLLGAVLTGVFAAPQIGGAAGLVAGNPGQVTTQLFGILVTILWSGVWTLIILAVIGVLLGLRRPGVSLRGKTAA